jgi:hypothetical protein
LRQPAALNRHRRHFAHTRIKQFGVHALGFERLHYAQHVAGACFVVQQDSHHATLNRAARHRIQAERWILLQPVDVFWRYGISLLVAQGNAELIGNA